MEGLASCGTTLVPKSSIILSTRAPIGSLAIAKTDLCTNQGCKSLVPFGATDSDFYGYLLSICAGELNVRGKGTTFLELSGDELGAFKVPAPPAPEQREISAFLDRETAKIDALIAEQQRLIELLKPDIYVKGGDYHHKVLPERELVESLGGEVVLIDLVPERSTSALIAKIKALP
mgnify:CR=1 FL=1